MRLLRISVFCWLVLLAGCASTKITSSDSRIGDEKLSKPGRILVYDFATTPSDIPADSVLAGTLSDHQMPQSRQEIETGRALGASVAKELVARIDAMGLPGERGTGAPPPRNADLVIRGYFVAVDTGSTAKRVLIGFGSGAAELKTVVEVMQMTPAGLRRLGGGEVASGGGKTPGMIVPVIVTAATANPIGLIVGGAVKAGMELSGTQGIEATGKRSADEIADRLEIKFEEQGWIAK